MANLCPKDYTACIDDSCRSTQECVYGGHGPLLDKCTECGQYYSAGEPCGCETCFDDDDDDNFEPSFDCHMDKDGGCGKAGSEECEFECPYNNH